MDGLSRRPLFTCLGFLNKNKYMLIFNVFPWPGTIITQHTQQHQEHGGGASYIHVDAQTINTAQISPETLVAGGW